MRIVHVTCLAVLLGLVTTSVAQELLPEDPIGAIAADMGDAVRKLSKLNTGKTTQGTQKEIIAKLDRLIEELEKECAACKAGRIGANPTKPAADSTIRSGPGGQSSLHAAKSGNKKWGELPPHQRDRILQSQTQGFPPHYQQILERYYRRLAEEKPAADAENTDGPAPKRPTTPAAPIRKDNESATNESRK
jgi:hypothetical protein